MRWLWGLWVEYFGLLEGPPLPEKGAFLLPKEVFKALMLSDIDLAFVAKSSPKSHGPLFGKALFASGCKSLLRCF